MEPAEGTRHGSDAGDRDAMLQSDMEQGINEWMEHLDELLAGACTRELMPSGGGRGDDATSPVRGAGHPRSVREAARGWPVLRACAVRRYPAVSGGGQINFSRTGGGACSRPRGRPCAGQSHHGIAVSDASLTGVSFATSFSFLRVLSSSAGIALPAYRASRGLISALAHPAIVPARWSLHGGGMEEPGRRDVLIASGCAFIPSP